MWALPFDESLCGELLASIACERSIVAILTQLASCESHNCGDHQLRNLMLDRQRRIDTLNCLLHYHSPFSGSLIIIDVKLANYQKAGSSKQIRRQ